MAQSRRDFIKSAALGIATAGVLGKAALPLAANPLGLPVGCQTYPVRAMIDQDFPGTIKTLAAAGFQSIELCSPFTYEEYAPVRKYSGAELRRLFSDAGVTCISSHFDIRELRSDLSARIAWAKEVGLTQMLVPSLNGPRNPTLDDLKRSADEYNKIAAETARAGMQQGLHNEDFEMSSVGNRRTYDLLFELLDPKLVKFQFQVSTVSHGFDAAEYLTKYPGRFISLHCQGWDTANRTVAAIGGARDSLDWKKIFSAAKVGGIKNYYVEMDLDLMRASAPYLKRLNV